MRTRRRLPALGVAALAIVVALTACQSLGGGGDAPEDPPPAGPDANDPPAVPIDADADAPLVQVEQRGGFVPVGYDFASVPEITVYPDGRAIIHGPMILIYPGPALPNLLVVRLSEADLEALVAAARDAGLLAEAPGYGQPSFADAATTFVTLTVDGQAYVHAAEALGVAEGGDVLLPDDGAAAGFTEDEQAARNTLAGFIGRVRDLIGAGGEEQPYPIRAFALFARPAEGGTGLDEGIEPEVVAWPLDLALADVAECTAVTGADAATLLEALGQANTLTQFEQDGVAYEVFTRPLLPHETGCDFLGGGRPGPRG